MLCSNARPRSAWSLYWIRNYVYKGWSLKWQHHNWCVPSGEQGHRDLWETLLHLREAAGTRVKVVCTPSHVNTEGNDEPMRWPRWAETLTQTTKNENRRTHSQRAVCAQDWGLQPMALEVSSSEWASVAGSQSGEGVGLEDLSSDSSQSSWREGVEFDEEATYSMGISGTQVLRAQGSDSQRARGGWAESDSGTESSTDMGDTCRHKKCRLARCGLITVHWFTTLLYNTESIVWSWPTRTNSCVRLMAHCQTHNGVVEVPAAHHWSKQNIPAGNQGTLSTL